MKNLLVSFAFTFIAASAFSQSTVTKEKPVYLRFPTIPQFTITNAADSSHFTREDLKKRKSTMFFVFSPDCSHCQHETEAIIKKLPAFKNTQIIMVTHLPYADMMAFYNHYKIGNYPQITMGWDTKYFFPIFFNVSDFPSIFIYDKNGHFKKAFEGSVKVTNILAAINS